MGYLNFQAIHHLFPSMPQHNGGKVSVKLIEFCKENNINYKIIGYRKAWYDMLSNLDSVGNIKMVVR
jgi:fatty acid desaturase